MFRISNQQDSVSQTIDVGGGRIWSLGCLLGFYEPWHVACHREYRSRRVWREKDNESHFGEVKLVLPVEIQDEMSYRLSDI